MFRAFINCNTTQSKCHKTQMFIFISYLANFTGVRAESRDGRTAAVADFCTLISTYSCCSCTQPAAIDETALWISELSKFAHNEFSVFKRRENHTAVTV